MLNVSHREQGVGVCVCVPRGGGIEVGGRGGGEMCLKLVMVGLQTSPTQGDPDPGTPAPNWPGPRTPDPGPDP